MSTVERLAQPPDLLSLHALDTARYPFLLESTAHGSGLGRFDILFAFPGKSLTLNSQWQIDGAGNGTGDFLGALDQWWGEESLHDPPEDHLPFRGGWFVFLAYELARQVEPSLAIEAEADCPVARAVRVPAALVRDRRTGCVYACAESGHEALLEAIHTDIERLRTCNCGGSGPLPRLVTRGSVREDPPGRFLAAVRAVQRHIAAGDVYQANISRRWQARLEPGVEAWTLYQRLRRANPSPFGGLAVMDEMSVVSSSPERLLRVRNRRVETRPIAGTLPRQNPDDPEIERQSELVADPKERAEHVMLVDLERNDLGRICRPGTIHVDEFMVVESYQHVHHIVSNVSGVLRPGVGPGAALRAVFPGGTITGCPKVRCMGIIHELEGRPRGAYTGAMGYLNRDGSCDFNILIRTLTLRGPELSLNAGSGIVADSVAETELAETRAKAKGMLLTLEA